MKNSLVLSFICFMVLCFSGCSLITPKDYESIKGKQYHLSKIHFFRKGATHNSIFKLMNDMQFPKIMHLLEHKYDISVDYSEFDLFLYNKDPLKLRAEGLLANNDFYWESIGEHPNRIEIDVLLTETSATSFDRDYTIAIKVGKPAKVRVHGSFAGDIPTLTEIASRLNYSKKSASDYVYINKDTKEEIDLSLEFVENKNSPEAEAERNYTSNLNEIRTKFKDFYDGLSPADRERYIKDMRDYLDELTE